MAHSLYNTIRNVTLTAALAATTGCAGMIYNGKDMPKPIPAPVYTTAVDTDSAQSIDSLAFGAVPYVAQKPTTQAPAPAKKATQKWSREKPGITLGDTLFTTKSGNLGWDVAKATLPDTASDAIVAKRFKEIVAWNPEVNFGKDIGYVNEQKQYVLKENVDGLKDQMPAGVTLRLYDRNAVKTTAATPAAPAPANAQTLQQKVQASDSAYKAVTENLKLATTQRDSIKALYDSLGIKLAQADSSVTKLRADSMAARTVFTTDSLAYKTLQDSLAAIKTTPTTTGSATTPAAAPGATTLAAGTVTTNPQTVTVINPADSQTIANLQQRIAQLEQRHKKFIQDEAAWKSRESSYQDSLKKVVAKNDSLAIDLENEKGAPLGMYGLVLLIGAGFGASGLMAYSKFRSRKASASGGLGGGAGA